ncbi:MAG: ATP synthase F0 subunit B, partial [Chloroflexi bacterium]|nr:hypothetical protein [Chloroflexota bacterium]NOH14410.1 ATP synthase F0 subunit B [Chloroflexota bacterium]
MDQLGINIGFYFVHLINFIIMFIILRKWAFIPIMNVLERRRETVSQGIEDARVAAEARANAEQEAEKILADARAKAADEAREITARAEAQLKDVGAAAEVEATKIKEAAQVDAQAARDQA